MLRENELPGRAGGGRGRPLVGIVTEADLVLPDDEGDLHLPHYIELFGGMVFLEPLRPLRGAAAQGVRLDGCGHDDRGPRHGRAPDADRREAARADRTRPATTACRSSSDGRLVGVVTRVDVLGALARSERTPSARSRRVDLGAIERNCAAAALAAAPSCARSSRPTATATARCRRPGGARGRRDLARGGHGRARRRTCARQGIDGPAARDGRADARGAARGARGRRRRRGLDARVRRGVAARDGARACTSSSTPAWAGWARGTASEALRAATSRPRPTLELAGLMTHFATADEPGDDHFRAAARALPRRSPSA